MLKRLLAGLFLLILAAPVLIWFAREPLIKKSLELALSDTGYGISYKSLELKPLQGRLLLSNLSLEDTSSAQTLIHADQASASFEVVQLVKLNFQHLAVTASDVTINLPDSTPDSDNSDDVSIIAQEYLPYLGYVPGNISLERLRVISKADPSENLITAPQLSLAAVPGKPASMLEAVAFVAGGEITIGGELTATDENIDYSLSVRAEAEDMAPILAATGAELELAGKLLLDASVTGDLGSMSLAIKEAGLSNGEHYQFNSAGTLDWVFERTPEAALSFKARLDDGGQLARWLQQDLGMPITGSASGNISGAIDDPRLEEAALRLSSGDRISVSLRGSGYPMRYADKPLGAGDRALVELDIADAADLEQFTGELPIVMGAVKGRFRLQGNADELQVDKLKLDIEQIGELRGSTRLNMQNSQFALSDLDMRLLDQGKPALRVQGERIGLTPLERIQLNVKLNGLSIQRIINLAGIEAEAGALLGALYGGFAMDFSQSKQVLNIENLDIANRDARDLRLNVSGQVDWNPQNLFVDVKLQTWVRDTTLLHELSGLHLKPVFSELTLKGSDEQISMSGITRIGKTELDSRIQVQVDGTEISDIKGSVSSPRILLSDLGLDNLLQDQGDDKSSERRGTLDTKLPLEQLPAFSFDTILVAAKVVGRDVRADNLVAHLKHSGDVFEVKQLAMTLPGGGIEAAASLTQSQRLPDWRLKGRIVDFKLQNLIAELGGDMEIAGALNSRFNLNSSGDTQRIILRELRGDTTIALEDIAVKGAAYDQMATDTIGWFFTGGALKDETRFDCVMGDFKIGDGVIQSDSLFAESDHLVANGNTSIDLRNFTVDAAITPRSKRRAFQIPGTIKINGPLDDPSITTPALAVGADAYAQVIMIAPSVAIGVLDQTGIFGGGKREKKKAELASPCLNATQAQ